MKKIVAISLLLLLFFNWYGYRIWSVLLEQKADTRLEASIDQEDYDASQLIELRIPIQLPYHNDWNDFERYTGEIELNGIHYNYVKRKVEKGELVLLCLPNKEKQLLSSARDQFFQLVNDLQQTDNGKKTEKGNSTTGKVSFPDYKKEHNDWVLTRPEAFKPDFSGHPPIPLGIPYASSPEQPPESAS